MKNRFDNWKMPVFDKDGWTKYGWRCQYNNKLTLGRNVDIGCFTYINARMGVEIGDNVQIGSHCAIYSDNTENNVSGRVYIGDNVLIGSYTLILPNVYIRSGKKIKAKSIVLNKNNVTTII